MEKFILPYYIPVKPIKTNILEVYIKDENGKEVSFFKKATMCTFHFGKKLWLINKYHTFRMNKSGLNTIWLKHGSKSNQKK